MRKEVAGASPCQRLPWVRRTTSLHSLSLPYLSFAFWGVSILLVLFCLRRTWRRPIPGREVLKVERAETAPRIDHLRLCNMKQILQFVDRGQRPSEKSLMGSPVAVSGVGLFRRSGTRQMRMVRGLGPSGSERPLSTRGRRWAAARRDPHFPSLVYTRPCPT